MRRLLVLLPMLVFAGATAMADGLDINWREARVVRLAKPATSVVVGDPTVADVTLDDPQTMIIFGKTPGQTNLLVLSGSQELLLDWPILVSPVTGRHVSVLDATATDAPTEVLYACGGERCTRVLSPTDVQFSSSATSRTSSDSDASKSSTTSENSTNPVGTANQNAVPAATDTGGTTQ